jgi:hypothetical protein
MSHMRFGGVCCCCRVLNDDFDRDNSTDLGNNWTEASGDWSILSNGLKNAASSGGIALCDSPHPMGECEVVARVTWTGGSLAAEGGLVTNYVDANNYSYAVITRKAPGVGDTLEIYNVVGGAAATLEAGPLDIDDPATPTLTVCHANNILTAEVNGYRLSAQVDGTGDQVGVWSEPAGAQSNTFDNFTFWRHQNEHLKRCPECKHVTEDACCTESEDFYVVDLGAGGLTDTIYTACSFCDDIAGEFLVERAPSGGNDCIWEYSGNLTQCDCDNSDEDCDEPGYPGTVDIDIEVTRYVSGDGCKWRVTVAATWNCSPNGIDPCGGPSATYHSAEVTTDDQDDLPVTLTLSASSTTRCGGAWPATIIVETP